MCVSCKNIPRLEDSHEKTELLDCEQNQCEWLELNGNWYLINKEINKRVVNSIYLVYDINNDAPLDVYYIDEDGKMVSDKFVNHYGSLNRYYGKDGKAEIGLFEYNGEKYYAEPSLNEVFVYQDLLYNPLELNSVAHNVVSYCENHKNYLDNHFEFKSKILTPEIALHIRILGIK